MRKPNFFIIGAPKCGTTSLAAWLSRHRQIYFSPVKEPHFFNTDAHRPSAFSLRAYDKLFSKATPAHSAIGEGSTSYLRSNIAVENLLDYSPSARLVVCLRNPVEMAYSLHGQRLAEGYEHVGDFEAAWRLSPERAAGRAVTRWCPSARLLVYDEQCRLGSQLERVLKLVPRDRVFTILLDEMQADPRLVYQQVLGFLRVDDDGRKDFPVANSAAQLRSVRLQRFITMVGDAKRVLRLRHGLGALNALEGANTVRTPRPPMRPELRGELADHFREEIGKLESLLDRDLSGWRH